LRELFKALKDLDIAVEKSSTYGRLVSQKDIVDRYADYITRAEWDDPKGMRYFQRDGIEVSREEAEMLGKDLIGENMQYDWMLKINSEEMLRATVDTIKLYASKIKLNSYGRKIFKNELALENKVCIQNAWDIPLLTCTHTDQRKPANLKDFLRVYEFQNREMVGDEQVVVSTLVKSNWKKLRQRLNINPVKVKKYALRVFVEDYIEA